MNPSPYCPRTAYLRISSGLIGRIAWRTLTFSLRAASPSKEIGGSIAISDRSWNMWFCIMSRTIPAVS